MTYSDGTIGTSYDGTIRLNTKVLHVGPGIVEDGNMIRLDPHLSDMLAGELIRREIESVGFDSDKISKMLAGSQDDRNIAYELLRDTKYTIKLYKAMVIKDYWTINYTLEDYNRNNRLNFSKTIL